jgi:hypothetical protein
MMNQTAIDELFKLCEKGPLAVSTLASIPHVTELRDIDDRSLFEVALEYNHVDIVEYILHF